MVMKKKSSGKDIEAEQTAVKDKEVELNKLYDARDLLLDSFNKALKKVEASTSESNSLAVAIATVEEKITELGGALDDVE